MVMQSDVTPNTTLRCQDCDNTEKFLVEVNEDTVWEIDGTGKYVQRFRVDQQRDNGLWSCYECNSANVVETRYCEGCGTITDNDDTDADLCVSCAGRLAEERGEK